MHLSDQIITMKKKKPYQLELEFKRTEYQTEFSLTQVDDPVCERVQTADHSLDSTLNKPLPKVKISTATNSRFYRTKTK
ncbi:hypothetical protein [Marinicella rhabdoformis]|uniref:hypothetical protein n=1 Tax=Marinicella rhabdoformis TaxID=2580566 RepID=UPI0012AEB49A|nr:hypothetical protein [Marinicella rhabdoformis]